MWRVLLAALIGCGMPPGLVNLARGADNSADIEFFEKQIRPLLVEHCQSCHGAEKSKGGLRLDHAEGWRAGGDSGPAVVPGKPDESLLISAVRHAGLEMPPKGKLPSSTIQLLEQWVARGAPGPGNVPVPPTANGQRGLDLAAGRQFWAYQPPRATPLPAVDDTTWSKSPIDRFVFARLQQSGLQPSPEAGRAILVRRLYFDLWGLPPTVAELDACAQDASADWYERLVDRLLASPRFGERWGRHWLDIVRFGESLTLRGFVLPDAWRYRDYVITAFNEDRPYDQFVREQIAGDLLAGGTLAERQRQLVATTFLTLGNTNLEEQDKGQLDMDVVDEQLDVIGKALLGQTITCARCHDHKFDPIPTRDYYALAGILWNARLLDHANVSTWTRRPLPLPEEQEAVFARQEEEISQQAAAVEACRARVAALARGTGQDLNVKDVVAVTDVPGVVVDDTQAKKVGRWESSKSVKPYIGAGYVHDADAAKGEKTLSFVPELTKNGRYEIRLAYTASANRASSVPVTVFSADGEKLIHLDMRRAPPLDGRFVSLGEYRCEVAGQSFVLVSNEGTAGHVVVDAVQFLPVDEAAKSTDVDAEDTSARAASTTAELTAEKQQLKQLEKDLKRRQAAARPRPMAMSVVERENISDLPIHIRGSVHSLGEIVPRGFLQVVDSPSAAPPSSRDSGRRELAEWLVAAENPLTARVYVNRAWHWLFGQGLVRTVDNFGTTGEQPSHPELLDHLALYLMSHKRSTKELVRYIVLSQAYRQSSVEREAGLAADPENRLVWRNNRQRLDAECLRDAMLAVSEQLQFEQGGATIRAGTAADYGYVDDSARRSVYVPVLRNALPEIFEAFDFPDPSVVIGRRNVSTVAPQALFLMNSPFVREQAEAAAKRLLDGTESSAERSTDAARVEHVFRQVVGRLPVPAERAVVDQMLSARVDVESPVAAWADVYHLLFSSLDFRYRD